MPDFQLVTEMTPKGDQPQAIAELTQGLEAGLRRQTLLGVTGSGKTFTMANVIARVQRPTLVVSHNKVLAAQLYREFKDFFPHNAVEYFVSYYDYYQPEAYLPKTDTYIEKDASINEELDRMRLSAATSLFERRDVIVVASVSCIYGLGSPEDYKRLLLRIEAGQTWSRRDILRRLVDQQYERNDTDFHHGTFRVQGDVIDIFPSYRDAPVRIELFGDEVDRIAEIDPITGKVFEPLENVIIYPAKYYVTPEDRLRIAIQRIEAELEARLEELNSQGKLLEAQRLGQRTRFDLEMLREVGYCQGIENYSRHLALREEGERPYCLLDYFPDDLLTFVDESHMMIPQIHGMSGGDRSRKLTLVEHGFRLPSALDNRPLRFDEFDQLLSQVIFVSATPAEYELSISQKVVEQIIRPTGLVDPPVVIRPATGQVDDLIGRIRGRVSRKERVLITTLTKRMAEDLSEYLNELGFRVRYLHFMIDTLERVEILEGLRRGDFDVIVGINLLREGLDLPEVSLVAILDADKEGFLRAERSLIQICGRAARNVGGEVVMYADTVTDSIKRAVDESSRRRNKQLQYNEEHNIEPQTVQKSIRQILDVRTKKKVTAEALALSIFDRLKLEPSNRQRAINELRREMLEAAKNLEFEKAAVIRDKIRELEAALQERESPPKRRLRTKKGSDMFS
jgi:excinuclease ABC subunit B